MDPDTTRNSFDVTKRSLSNIHSLLYPTLLLSRNNNLMDEVEILSHVPPVRKPVAVPVKDSYMVDIGDNTFELRDEETVPVVSTLS